MAEKGNRDGDWAFASSWYGKTEKIIWTTNWIAPFLQNESSRTKNSEGRRRRRGV